MAVDHRAKLEEVFDQLSADLRKDLETLPGLPRLPDEVIQRVKECLEATTHGGKYTCAMSVIDTALGLATAPLTAEKLHEIYLLAWILEIYIAAILVVDDIMDNGTMRRGKPCWHRRPEIGLTAANDAMILWSVSLRILMKYFYGHHAYLEMYNHLQLGAFITQLGQACDTMNDTAGRVGFQSFTQQRLETIILYKTTYMAFRGAALLILHYMGLATSMNLDQAERISCAVSYYLQIEDDFLDVYADPRVIRKVGTDIQENKCGWPIVKALELCNDDQRQELERCYGRCDVTAVARVKDIFKELDLEKHYDEAEAKEIAHIRTLISQLDESEGLRKAVFNEYLTKVIKRRKWEV